MPQLTRMAESESYIDLSDRPLVVFGAGVAGKTLIRKLQGVGFLPQLILDEAYGDNDCLGVPVVNPERVQLDDVIKKKARVIIAIIPECSGAAFHFSDLVKKLYGWGFVNLYRIDYHSYHLSECTNDGKYSEWRFFDSLTQKQLLAKREQACCLVARENDSIATALGLFGEPQTREIFLSGIDFLQGNQTLGISRLPGNQYFIPDLYAFNKIETVVDGGAYTGDTAGKIMKLFAGLKRLYCFEPSLNEFEKLVAVARQGKAGLEMHCCLAGLGEGTGLGNFVQDISEAQKIGMSANLSLIFSLDDYLHGVRPDLVKMDIEGAEKSALLGARTLIRRYEPVLAICVYHKPQDLWEIPLVIQAMGVDYQYFLRRHSLFSWNETVCYAVPKRLAVR